MRARAGILDADPSSRWDEDSDRDDYVTDTNEYASDYQAEIDNN